MGEPKTDYVWIMRVAGDIPSVTRYHLVRKTTKSVVVRKYGADTFIGSASDRRFFFSEEDASEAWREHALASAEKHEQSAKKCRLARESGMAVYSMPHDTPPKFEWVRGDFE